MVAVIELYWFLKEIDGTCKKKKDNYLKNNCSHYVPRLQKYLFFHYGYFIIL